jgi:hypothetical protein
MKEDTGKAYKGGETAYVFTEETPPNGYDEWDGKHIERPFIYDEVSGDWLKKISLQSVSPYKGGEDWNEFMTDFNEGGTWASLQKRYSITLRESVPPYKEEETHADISKELSKGIPEVVINEIKEEVDKEEKK